MRTEHSNIFKKRGNETNCFGRRFCSLFSFSQNSNQFTIYSQSTHHLFKLLNFLKWNRKYQAQPQINAKYLKAITKAVYDEHINELCTKLVSSCVLVYMCMPFFLHDRANSNNCNNIWHVSTNCVNRDERWRWYWVRPVFKRVCKCVMFDYSIDRLKQLQQQQQCLITTHMHELAVKPFSHIANFLDEFAAHTHTHTLLQCLSIEMLGINANLNAAQDTALCVGFLSSSFFSSPLLPIFCLITFFFTKLQTFTTINYFYCAHQKRRRKNLSTAKKWHSLLFLFCFIYFISEEKKNWML